MTCGICGGILGISLGRSRHTGYTAALFSVCEQSKEHYTRRSIFGANDLALETQIAIINNLF